MMDYKREYLLLASYCDGDERDCTEEHPCCECLQMCNIFTIPQDTKTIYSRSLEERDMINLP
jgi:hypothetical protein